MKLFVALEEINCFSMMKKYFNKKFLENDFLPKNNNFSSKQSSHQ
jgi:hypothetical protein